MMLMVVRVVLVVIKCWVLYPVTDTRVIDGGVVVCTKLCDGVAV